MFWSTFIALQHLFMLKCQVDKEKICKVSYPNSSKKLFNIGLSVEKSIFFLGHGKAIIWPIVGGGMLIAKKVP